MLQIKDFKTTDSRAQEELIKEAPHHKGNTIDTSLVSLFPLYFYFPIF
jgi:hypothetical protein